MSHDLIHLHLFHIRKKFSVHTTIEIIRYVGERMTSQRTPIKLTPRGTYVFYMSLSGFTTVKIARHLKMTKSGVRRHREKMLMINDCDSMLELAAKYYGTYTEQ